MQPLAKRGQHLRGQDGGRRAIPSPLVAQRREAFGIVAGPQLLDPPLAERGDLGHLGHAMALSQQSDRL
jgi:hypothetical protein